MLSTTKINALKPIRRTAVTQNTVLTFFAKFCKMRPLLHRRKHSCIHCTNTKWRRCERLHRGKSDGRCVLRCATQLHGEKRGKGVLYKQIYSTQRFDGTLTPAQQRIVLACGRSDEQQLGRTLLAWWPSNKEKVQKNVEKPTTGWVFCVLRPFAKFKTPIKESTHPTVCGKFRFYLPQTVVFASKSATRGKLFAHLSIGNTPTKTVKVNRTNFALKNSFVQCKNYTLTSKKNPTTW